MGSICKVRDSYEKDQKIIANYKSMILSFGKKTQSSLQPSSIMIQVIDDFDGSFTQPPPENYDIVRAFREKDQPIYVGMFGKQLLKSLNYLTSIKREFIVIQEPNTNSQKYIEKMFFCVMQTLLTFDRIMLDIGKKKSKPKIIIGWDKIQYKKKISILQKVYKAIPSTST